MREVPFAALPLLFALHQFVEVFVWLGSDGQVSSCVWCILAACSSLLVLVHMRRRRRLPDAHRLNGHPEALSRAV